MWCMDANSNNKPPCKVRGVTCDVMRLPTNSTIITIMIYDLRVILAQKHYSGFCKV